MSPSALSFLLLSLLINGCGSSNRASTTARSSPKPKPAPAVAQRSAASAPASPPRPATSASASPPRLAAGTATTATTGATNVRLPAAFVIAGHGALRPPAVAAPAGVTIELTLVSGDRRPHRAVLRTTPSHALAVPAGGRVSLQLTGLKTGHYALDVDGARAGSLDVGAQPGP